MQAYQPYETPTGPQLEVLAQAETRLPAPLKQKAVAVVLAAVMALAAVFGLGGGKLHSKYNAAASEFMSTSESHGISMSMDLAERLNAAANIVTIAKAQGGSFAALESAEQAIDALEQALEQESPAACYDANVALGKAIDLLHQELLTAGVSDTKSLDSQWDEFQSRQFTLDNAGYNDAADGYNETASGVPAGLIAAVWGGTEVERFG